MQRLDNKNWTACYIFTQHSLWWVLQNTSTERKFFFLLVRRGLSDKLVRILFPPPLWPLPKVPSSVLIILSCWGYIVRGGVNLMTNNDKCDDLLIHVCSLHIIMTVCKVFNKIDIWLNCITMSLIFYGWHVRKGMFRSNPL